MKIYRLPQLVEEARDGQYLLSGEAVGMLYGRLAPGELNRKVSPDGGSEHIIHIIKGEVRVRHGRSAFTAARGEAFLTGETVFLDNTGEGDALYTSLRARLATEKGQSAVDGPDGGEPAEKTGEDGPEEQKTSEEDPL